MNTRPFDLEAAKRGDAICLGSGQPLRLVAYVPESVKYPVWCVDPDGDRHLFTATGIFVGPAACPPQDLHMVVKTKTVWVNLYLNGEGDVTTHGVRFGTEEAATAYGKESILRTVSVEIPS